MELADENGHQAPKLGSDTNDGHGHCTAEGGGDTDDGCGHRTAEGGGDTDDGRGHRTAEGGGDTDDGRGHRTAEGDGDTHDGRGHQTADNLDEAEQQQRMALKNSALESVNFQENQQLKLEDRTVPVEKLPETAPIEKLADAVGVKNLSETVPLENLPDMVPVKKLAETVPLETLPDAVPVKKLVETVQLEKLPDTVPVKKLQETVSMEKLPETLPVKKLPETNTPSEDIDANRVDVLNVFSSREAGIAVEGESDVCLDRIKNARDEGNSKINPDIMPGVPLIETKVQNKDKSLVDSGLKDDTSGEINRTSEEDTGEKNSGVVESSLTEAQIKGEDTSSLTLPAIRDDNEEGIDDAVIIDVSLKRPGKQDVDSQLGQQSGELDSDDGARLITEGTDMWKTEPQTHMSHVPEAGGTEAAAKGDQAHTTISPALEKADHNLALDGVDHNPARVQDTTVDDLFNTSQHQSPGKDVRLSYFPALDNVDFETDEEGQELEKDVGDTEKGRTVTGRRRRSEDGSDSDVQIPADRDSDSKETVTDSTLHRDYPLNYQNYKVCREVRPGVEECLILETGEQFFCISKTQKPDGSSMHDPEVVGAHRSALLVQPETASSGPGDASAPIISDVAAKNVDDVPANKVDGVPANKVDGVPAHNVDENHIQPVSSLISVLSRAEVFSYISLQEDAQDQTEPRTFNLADSGQQAFITEHGVPVIFDNGEGDLGPGREAENGEGAAQAEKDVTVGSEDGGSYLKRDGVSKRNVVEDVLSSEGELNWSPQARESKEHSMKKSKNGKQDKFYELKPDATADIERTSGSYKRDSNCNNSANQTDLGVEENTNENANSHRSNGRGTMHRGEACIQSSSGPSSSYVSARSTLPESGNRTHSYDRGTPSSRDVGQSGSRSFYQSTSRDSSYFGSRDYHSKDDSSYYRSKDPSSVDSSQMSTRYSRIHHPDASSVTARPESVTVPKFKTLQDQQVSWLDMFKVIEQQHRTELQSQYREHQKVLQEMQRNMEKELLKQQDTLKQRLMSHREMLEDLSPYRHAGQNINHSWAQSEDVSSVDIQRASDHGLSNKTSQITLQGVPVALRNPPPMSRYHNDTHKHKFVGDELPVKRSLEKELQSPVKPADTSLSQTTSLSIDRDKQLRGGVYSSPFPLAHVKHKKSARASKSYESTQRRSPREEVSHNSNSIHWEHDAQTRDNPSAGSPDLSFADSDDVLSPRTKISLREKHAKHLADIRAYYEKELQDLRREKEMKAGGCGLTQNATVEQRILANENQELRQKYQRLQDAYHDAKIEIRELKQKIQGLEIRAADYAERYDAAQSQVLTLKSRLEELADYVRDKESLIADLESKNRKNADSLQLAYKKEKELADSLHNARNTIQKLVDKYETLEKDHDIVKETLVETQEKLYASRAELIEVNNKLSRSELENKQLKHDIENLKLDLAMARSAVPMQTSYEEAYHKSSSDQHQSSYSQATTNRSRSVERSYSNHRRDDNEEDEREETTAESESDREYARSPLIKAENEWKLRQQSRDFTPKLQRKFYGTEIPGNYSGPPITVDRTSLQSVDSPRSSAKSSPRDKRTHAALRSREFVSRSGSSKSSSHLPGSPKDHSRLSRHSEKPSPGTKNHSISPKKVTTLPNGLTSEEALERIKSGDVVSRPAWEDVYTSLATGRSAGGHEIATPPTNYTRDQIIRERLQNIENLEKKYDDLTNEKRRLEASLSKLPVQGHGRERDRLESELDRVDRDLGSVRMSLKRYHVLKSTI